MRGHCCQHDGAAIGARAGGGVGADVAARAPLVVDDNGLTQCVSHVGCDESRNVVGWPTRRPTDDQGDGPRRQRGLCPADAGQGE